MSKRPFIKPPTTFAEQVALLQSRGIMVADPAQAGFYLQHLNYYRLGAYWLPFEDDHASHRFKSGIRQHLSDLVEGGGVDVFFPEHSASCQRLKCGIVPPRFKGVAPSGVVVRPPSGALPVPPVSSSRPAATP